MKMKKMIIHHINLKILLSQRKSKFLLSQNLKILIIYLLAIKILKQLNGKHKVKCSEQLWEQQKEMTLLVEVATLWEEHNNQNMMMVESNVNGVEGSLTKQLDKDISQFVNRNTNRIKLRLRVNLQWILQRELPQLGLENNDILIL